MLLGVAGLHPQALAQDKPPPIPTPRAATRPAATTTAPREASRPASPTVVPQEAARPAEITAATPNLTRPGAITVAPQEAAPPGEVTAALREAAPPGEVTAALREAARPGEITVATRAVEPFIIQDGDQISGFSADLWRAIAAELGVKTSFAVYKTLPELMESVRNGTNPAGIAAISITAQREKSFEFSQPMFRSGLSIMVPEDGQQFSVASLLFSTETLKGIGIFLLVLIIPAHLIWFLARGRDEGLPIRPSYAAGIVDAIFWCAESMGGAAQAHPSRVFARVAALIWIYAGLIFVTYFTAYATTTLTMQGLRGDINDPKDLAGKRVAVVQGSTSAQYITGMRARTFNFPDFKSAATAMLAGNADAVVYDAPVLLYYVKNEPRARIAGSTFRAENYGIIFPLGSPMRRPVNEILLKLVENGTYASLYKKWFGEENSGQ
jgi:polar amino acid transport system substrate-binding protein